MTLDDLHRILVPSLFTFVFGLVVYLFFKSRMPLDIEKGLKPLLNVRCSSYLDGIRHGFTRFTMYDNFLVVKSRKEIVLRYKEITKVTQGRVFLNKSLDIWHTRIRFPSISLIMKDIDTPMQMIESKLNQKAYNKPVELT